MLVVVRLDVASQGSGPGTVLEVTTRPIGEVRASYMDRDGVVSADLRIWRAFPSVSVGDRVSMTQGRTRTRT